jgi:ArsR family transcriptional regulator
VALRRFKAEVFHVLGHPTRIHIAECLRGGRRPVHDILLEVGVEPANLSQHLRVLRTKGLVVQERQAGSVFYSLRDPLLIVVLDAMREYFHAHLEEALWVLRGIEEA